MKHSLHSSAAAFLFTFIAAPCGAATVINNFGAGTQGFAAGLSGPTAEIFFSPYDNHQVAFSFTTGPAAAEITGLRFVVSIGDVLLDPIHAALSTGSPVAGPVSSVSLGSVTPPSASPITQTLEIVPPATVTLTPATTYWVHLTVPSGGAVYSFLNNNVPVFEPGWSLGNTFFYDPVDGWMELTSGPQARIQLNVNPVPVPEPAGLLPALTIGGAVILRRRRAERLRN